MKRWYLAPHTCIVGSKVIEREATKGIVSYDNERDALERLIHHLRDLHVENALYINHLEGRLRELKDKRL